MADERRRLSARDVRRQGRDVVRGLAWIVRDTLRLFRWGTVLAWGLAILTVTTGGLALGGVVIYAKAAERAEPVRIAGFEIRIDDMTVFVVFVAAIGLIGVISAASFYASEWLINKLTHDYQRVLVRRLLLVTADPAYRGWPACLSGPVRETVMRLYGIGTGSPPRPWRGTGAWKVRSIGASSRRVLAVWLSRWAISSG